MAFTATQSTDSTRARPAFSMGPIKWQLMTYTCSAGDTNGVITAPGLVEVQGVLMDGGATLSTFTTSTNTATLTFQTNQISCLYTCTFSAVATMTVGTRYFDSKGNLFIAAVAASNTVNGAVTGGSTAPTSSILNKGSGDVSGDSTSFTVSSYTAPTIQGNVLVWGV